MERPVVIKAEVTRHEQEQAVLTTEHGTELRIPLNLLSSSILGQTLYLHIKPTSDVHEIDQWKAREILNTILQADL